MLARIGTDLEELRQRGMDVATWVREGWVDYLILCSTYDVNLERWRELVEGTGVRLHVSPDPRRGRGMGAWTADIYRAAASNYYRQGAEGIYHFNFWVRQYPFETEDYIILRDVSHPACLRYRDKRYLATDDNWREHTDTIPVSLADPERPARVAIEVADDLQAAQQNSTLHHALLRLRLGGWAAEDKIEVRLNGVKLDGRGARVDQPTQRSGSIKWQSSTTPWSYERQVLGLSPPITWELDLVETLPQPGENIVEVQRHGTHESNLLLADLDIVVAYDFVGKDGPAWVAGREEVQA
jgi:hypothetical protein